MLINYCIALARNEFEAKDLLQDSLLKALENFVALRDDGKFKSWFFTILTRQYYALHQKSIIKKTLFKRVLIMRQQSFHKYLKRK